MTEQNGGDSTNLDEAAKSMAFDNNNGETTPDKVDAPQGGDGQDGASSNKEGAPQDKGADSAMQESHRMVIDLIEDKFDTLQGEDLKTWFEDHKEFGDVANRSKRLKERYRALVESKETTPTKVETDEVKKEEKSESKKESSKEGLVTKDELLKILEEHSDRKIESTLRRDRKASVEKFASEHDIKDEEFVRFQKTANTLYEVNSEWTYDQALSSAHRALYSSKDKGVNVSGSSGGAQKSASDDSETSADLSAGHSVSFISDK